MGRTEKAARGLAVAPIPETRGGCRGAPSELPLSLTPALGARVPLSRLHAGTAPTARSSGDPQRRPTWGLGLRPELPTAGGAGGDPACPQLPCPGSQTRDGPSARAGLSAPGDGGARPPRAGDPYPDRLLASQAGPAVLELLAAKGGVKEGPVEGRSVSQVWQEVKHPVIFPSHPPTPQMPSGVPSSAATLGHTPIYLDVYHPVGWPLTPDPGVLALYRASRLLAPGGSQTQHPWAAVGSSWSPRPGPEGTSPS